MALIDLEAIGIRRGYLGGSSAASKKIKKKKNRKKNI